MTHLQITRYYLAAFRLNDARRVALDKDNYVLAGAIDKKITQVINRASFETRWHKLGDIAYLSGVDANYTTGGHYQSFP